nr:hypothetical protein [Tanacetum cinerariifolium]
QWVHGFAGEGGGVVVGVVGYGGVKQEVGKWKLQAWQEIWYREQCFKSWGEDRQNTKKWSKPDKIEHEIEKNAQKPDPKTFSVY